MNSFVFKVLINKQRLVKIVQEILFIFIKQIE